MSAPHLVGSDNEAANEEVARRTVRVSNLHHLVTLGKVKDLFSPVGEIEIVYRSSKTSASVVFLDQKHTVDAVKKTGTQLEGQTIHVVPTFSEDSLPVQE